MLEKLMNKIDEDFYKENNYYLSITEPESFAKIVAIEFAKLHVEAALKAASEKVTTNEDVAIFAEGTYRTQIIDKSSILNAYSLTNIK
jgi:hypothetical protein